MNLLWDGDCLFLSRYVAYHITSLIVEWSRSRRVVPSCDSFAGAAVDGKRQSVFMCKIASFLEIGAYASYVTWECRRRNREHDHRLSHAQAADVVSPKYFEHTLLYHSRQYHGRQASFTP